MLRSASLRMRMDGPSLRSVKQRSIKQCCSTCLGEEDEDDSSVISEEGHGHGHDQSRSWLNLTEDSSGARGSGLKWRWRWKWRWNGTKWLKREGNMISSIMYSRKTVHCNYDELSYAQNFDEGDWQEDDVYPYRGFSARFAGPAFPSPKSMETQM